MLRKASEQDVLPDYAAFELDFWREIYESGKQAVGKRNGIQWHDLRKNPKDLPKDRGEYLVCFRGGSHYGIGFVAENGLRFICYGEEYDDVIAWCEIPEE